jgi:hypothetical protein
MAASIMWPIMAIMAMKIMKINGVSALKMKAVAIVAIWRKAMNKQWRQNNGEIMSKENNGENNIS